MRRDYLLRILDIYECIVTIEKYIESKTEDDFFNSRLLQDAVIRRLEIIGEATKHVPEEIRTQFSEVPWKLMAGLRDIAIHDYVELIEKRIWNTLIYDLPKTKAQIEEIISSLKIKKPHNDPFLKRNS